MNTFNLSLDLDKTPDVPDWVTLRQGDKSGTVIVATIYDHGVQLVGTYNARVVIGNPDGEHYYRANATYSSGVATVTIDEQTAASVAGTTVGYFEILQGSTVIASTANFGVRILESALNEAVPGENYDSAIQDAIDGLNEAVAELPDTVEDILADHPEWTTTVQDGSISDTKLVQTGGVLSRTQRLTLGLDNLLTATPAEADSVSVSDAAKTPLAGLSVYGRSTQDGTPTPSSPVPIQSVAGNLYHQTLYEAGTTRTASGLNVTYNEDGTCTCTGTATANAWLWGGGNAADNRLFVLLQAGTYIVCGSHHVAAQKKVGDTVTTIFGTTAGYATFTINEPTLIKAVAVVPNGTTVTNETVWVALYSGTSQYPYVPYQHVGLWAKRTSDATQQSVTPIDLQGHELRSLPDGTRDELRIDAAGNVTLIDRIDSINLGSRNWTAVTSGALGKTYYANITGTNSSGTATGKMPGVSNVMCASLALGTATNALADGQMAGTTSNNRLYIRNDSWATAADAKTGLDGVILYFQRSKTSGYEPDPIITDLGTIDPVALQGPDMTAQAVPTAPFALTYERDLNIIIGGIYAQLAPVDGPTATSNHAAGTYLMLGGTLCKVTTAIAVGETISLGTNVVATTVMTEILALTA